VSGTEDFEMIIKLALCAVAAGVVGPALLTHQDADSRTRSLSNMKLAGLALLMYTNDYDDLYPYAQSTGAVVEVTRPYAKKGDIWWSDDGRRFLFNTVLGGVLCTSVERPAETVAISAEKPASDGTREVGLVDGHAKRMGPDSWKAVEPTLHLKLKKTATKPLPMNLGEAYNAQKPPPNE
jgi:hypothetical protein